MGSYSGWLWTVALDRPQVFVTSWGLEDSSPATQIHHDKFPELSGTTLGISTKARRRRRRVLSAGGRGLEALRKARKLRRDPQPGSSANRAASVDGESPVNQSLKRAAGRPVRSPSLPVGQTRQPGHSEFPARGASQGLLEVKALRNPAPSANLGGTVFSLDVQGGSCRTDRIFPSRNLNS